MRNLLTISLWIMSYRCALAIVGGAPVNEDSLSQSVVTIVGSRGTFCSGALIAPDIVLSAAHCIASGDVQKVIIPGETPPRLLGVKRVASHPQFKAQGIQEHRASADVALLQLTEPLPDPKAPWPIGVPRVPVTAGGSFIVVGVGVTTRGEGKSGGTIRSAKLVATGNPGNLQIRLTDPATNNVRQGLGACTGDSGAPVFQNQSGSVKIVGVVSWSTGANNSSGCGGLTGVTPLTLYRGWISKMALEMGSPIQ